MSTPRVVVSGAQALELRSLLLLRDQLTISISDWAKTSKNDHDRLVCLVDQQREIDFKISVLVDVYCSYEGNF